MMHNGKKFEARGMDVELIIQMPNDAKSRHSMPEKKIYPTALGSSTAPHTSSRSLNYLVRPRAKK